MTRYAEARALVGGATALQGASGKYPYKHEALAHNVDLRMFGQRKARSSISRATHGGPRAEARGDRLGRETAVYIHLAEGTDERARQEFDELSRPSC